MYFSLFLIPKIDLRTPNSLADDVSFCCQCQAEFCWNEMSYSVPLFEGEYISAAPHGEALWL